MIRGIEGGCIRHPEAVTGIAEPADSPVDAPAAAGFGAVLRRMVEGEREVHALLDRAMAEKLTDPQELLRMQVVVQRFQHQVELTARVAEQLNQAVRTLTRPQ